MHAEEAAAGGGLRRLAQPALEQERMPGCARSIDLLRAAQGICEQVRGQ